MIPVIASDAQSGLKEIRLYYRHHGGPWTQYPDAATPHSAAASTIAFDSRQTGGDGRYAFYTLATDNAGNTEPPPAAGWSLVDSELATHQGTGPARLGGVAAGAVTVNWLPLDSGSNERQWHDHRFRLALLDRT